MIRCFQVDLGYSGSIIASCAGTSEGARELFVYMDEQTLPQCDGQVDVADKVWLSVICDDDLIWGGKRQCLRSTKEISTADNPENQMDSCISSYECDKGEFQYCTGHGVIVSASADSKECLSDIFESSSSADPSTIKSTDPSTTSSAASSSKELSQRLLLLAAVGYCDWVFKL